MYAAINYLTLILALLIPLSMGEANSRFTSHYPCIDANKRCLDDRPRVIDGINVEDRCWQYAYSKTCNYPSKNDCRLYSHCYGVADHECLLKDSQNRCVNRRKEFSCESWQEGSINQEGVRTQDHIKEGKAEEVCTGVPCMDGNCFDKSYEVNNEMMESLAKLGAATRVKPDGEGRVNLFEGTSYFCSKKAFQYSNCCAMADRGWGRNIGAKCTENEKVLRELRLENLCVYACKEEVRDLGIHTVSKHHFCCFGNILDKVVQVEARKQLGISFSHGSTPNCRGLTLEEIQRIDWQRVDFSEVIQSLKINFVKTNKTLNINPDQLARTVDTAKDSMQQYDESKSDNENNMSGWHRDSVDHNVVEVE